VTEIVLITSSACHLCHDARAALDELSREFPIELRVVDIASAEGRRIVERFRPPMPPAVLVNGALFSFGRLPRKKLRRKLQEAA
jgi:hypothetical protein